MQQIPVTQLRTLLAESADPADAAAQRPVLLDVREPHEVRFAALAVDGFDTVHIPMGQIPATLGQLDANRVTVCFCHHGMRSLQVALFLENRGFGSVFNLQGGIDAWSALVDPKVPRY
jgi:rhodanese-related sulfurtransferase